MKNMDELNPNHPVTKEVHDNWHKIAAILLFKSGETETTITVEDIERFSKSGMANIAVYPKGNVMRLILVNDEQAKRLIQ